MARKNAPAMQNVGEWKLPINNVGVPPDFGVSYNWVASPVQLKEMLSQYLTVKEKEERAQRWQFAWKALGKESFKELGRISYCQAKKKLIFRLEVFAEFCC